MRRQRLVVQADLQLVLGGRPEHRELALAPQADGFLLGGDLELAEGTDLRDQPLVQRTQVRLGAGVDRVQRVGGGRTRYRLRLYSRRRSRAGGSHAGRGAAFLPGQVGHGVGVAVTQARLGLDEGTDLAVLAQAAAGRQHLELCQREAAAGLDVPELGGQRGGRVGHGGLLGRVLGVVAVCASATRAVIGSGPGAAAARVRGAIV
jgi:hypothetical protein